MLLLIGAAAGFMGHRASRTPQDAPDREQAELALVDAFKRARVPYPCPRVFVRAFKHERVVELWASPKQGARYRLIKSFPITAASGDLGPKRREGDLQVPEGFYRITEFNPNSKFHLSMRIDYPNASDKVLSDPEKPGFDIFIHGNQVSLGCIAIGDGGIEELYEALLKAKEAGQRALPIHIFPFRMTRAAMQEQADSPHEGFWVNIKVGYDLFESMGKPPLPSVSSSGVYQF